MCHVIRCFKFFMLDELITFVACILFVLMRFRCIIDIESIILKRINSIWWYLHKKMISESRFIQETKIILVIIIFMFSLVSNNHDILSKYINFQWTLTHFLKFTRYYFASTKSCLVFNENQLDTYLWPSWKEVINSIPRPSAYRLRNYEENSIEIICYRVGVLIWIIALAQILLFRSINTILVELQACNWSRQEKKTKSCLISHVISIVTNQVLISLHILKIEENSIGEGDLAVNSRRSLVAFLSVKDSFEYHLLSFASPSDCNIVKKARWQPSHQSTIPFFLVYYLQQQYNSCCRPRDWFRIRFWR